MLAKEIKFYYKQKKPKRVSHTIYYLIFAVTRALHFNHSGSSLNTYSMFMRKLFLNYFYSLPSNEKIFNMLMLSALTIYLKYIGL